MGSKRVPEIEALAKLPVGEYMNLGPFEQRRFNRLTSILARRKERGTMSDRFFINRNIDGCIIAGRLPRRFAVREIE